VAREEEGRREGKKEGGKKEGGGGRESALFHHMETNFVTNRCEVVKVVSGVGLVESGRDEAVTLPYSTIGSVKTEQPLQSQKNRFSDSHSFLSYL
jgi:hypothetical protein